MRTLRSGFTASVDRFGDRDALVLGEHRLNYRELDARARSIAATLDRHAPPGEGKLTAVYGHRHPTAFAGLLGALSRGHGYVPLNPAFPVERTRAHQGVDLARPVDVERQAAASEEAACILGDLVPHADGLRRVVLVEHPDAGRAAPAKAFPEGAGAMTSRPRSSRSKRLA